MYRRYVGAAVCLLFALGAWAAVWRLKSKPAARVYVVGFQNSPPRQFVADDGTPYGPVIDTIREAAQRAGLTIRWKQRAIRTG